MRIANAPLSYGAFELTVGGAFPVPDPARVVRAMADAGYAGTELGPPGYLDGVDLGDLELIGGFVQIPFSEPDAPLDELHATLDRFGERTGARPVLSDAGGPERVANPGRGGEDPALALDDARWRTLVANVARAADAARARGFEPVFHHHTSTYVESVAEIERFLADTDVPLLLDSAHLVVAGGDPLRALTDWAGRIEAIHVKDVRLDVLAAVKAERADQLTAWRRGLFCALGRGDVDLDAFCAAVQASGYDGWIVVEQDRVLTAPEAFEAAAADQVANRAWLREHAGW
ncbi:MAG TPA: sugar phosphate isomerase/epimerase [Solirubrobacter sp.]|nr:sugar phosphate isomerase/epimerase [Solirubrobacter sp.]